MNTLNTLTTLLSEHARKNGLKDIEFTESNGLRVLSNHLVTVTDDTVVENTNAAIHDTFIEFANLVNDPDYRDIFVAFQRISDAFYFKLNKSYEELKGIKDTVNKLVSSSEQLAKSRISEDPVLASLESEQSTITKLKPIQWGYLNNINQLDLERKFLNSLNLDSIPGGDERYFHELLIAHLPFGSANRQVELRPIEITKKKMISMVDTIASHLPNYHKQEVQNIFAHILHLDRIDCNKAINSIKNMTSGVSASKINQILRLTHSYNDVMNEISAESLDLAKSTMEGVMDRVNAMHAYIDLTTYMCMYYRNTIWKDAIVVPGMLINTDNWEEFCRADKQQIQSNPTLAIIQYKNKVYEDKEVPLHGIKGSTIVDRCETIAKEAYDIASSNTLRCNQKKKDIYRDSFIITAGKWLREQKNFSVEYAQPVPERFAASVYDSNRDDAVENMYYSVILNSCYVNTLTSTLHKRLRDEYKKAAATATTLTEKDILNIDTKVMADLISEHLINLVIQ